MLQRLLLVSTMVLGCGPIASAQTAKPHHAKLSLLSEHAGLAPGSSEWLGVRFELEPGWHIYWANPGDSGEPPKITWSLPKGMEAGALQFPAPKRIADHGLTDYGYEGNAVLLARLTISKTITSNHAAVSAEVKYLVCREVCMPGKEQLALDLPIKDESARGLGGSAAPISESRMRLPQALPRGVQLMAESRANDFVVTIGGQKPGVGMVTDFIPAEAQVLENSAKPKVEPYIDKIRLTLRKSEQLNRPVRELRGLLITQNTAYNVVIPVALAKATSRRPISNKDRSSQQPEE